MLAKRLIHGLSTSMDTEESMINKLKVLASSELVIINNMNNSPPIVNKIRVNIG